MAVTPQSSNAAAHLTTREVSLGKLLPGADSDSVTTDAEFKRVAYVVKRDGKELAVVDGVEGKEYDKVAVKSEMFFSPDGKRLTYVANRGQNRLVVVDGAEGKEYYFIYDLFNPVFSPDSRHIAYIAGTGPNSQWFAVLDGQEQKKCELVEGLMFSPDSQKLAYNADKRWNRGTCLVINGVEGKSYSGISDTVFSPDSSRVAFSAFKWHPDRSLVVIDGKDGPQYKGVESVGEVVFSPDSKHTAYAVAEANGNFVMRDTTPGIKFDSSRLFGAPVFSPNSKRLAYVVHGGPWKVILDDKIFDDQKNRNFVRGLAFSPDSRHLAYLSQVASATNTGYAYLILDGIVQQDSKGIFTNPCFTADGKRLAYLVRSGKHKETGVYGEFRGGEYDRFVECDADIATKGPAFRTRKPFVLDSDGTLRAIALRNGEIFRVELRISDD